MDAVELRRVDNRYHRWIAPCTKAAVYPDIECSMRQNHGWDR
jgi:hypothetical protein